VESKSITLHENIPNGSSCAVQILSPPKKKQELLDFSVRYFINAQPTPSLFVFFIKPTPLHGHVSSLQLFFCSHCLFLPKRHNPSNGGHGNHSPIFKPQTLILRPQAHLLPWKARFSGPPHTHKSLLQTTNNLHVPNFTPLRLPILQVPTNQRIHSRTRNDAPLHDRHDNLRRHRCRGRGGGLRGPLLRVRAEQEPGG